MTTDAIERKMNEDNSEFLLVLAKAAGLSWTITNSILALIGRQDRYFAGDPEQNQRAFHRLNQPTAQKILEFHRTRQALTLNG
jgi:hypothetical protein